MNGSGYNAYICPSKQGKASDLRIHGNFDGETRCFTFEKIGHHKK